MKRALFTILSVLTIAVTIHLSCTKEYSCEGCYNEPPIALAGPDQFITLPIDSVLVNGEASNDPDGKIKEWRWTKIAGPASFNSSQLESAKAVIRMLVEGIYQFELEVTDDKGARARDTTRIIVNSGVNSNHPPVACAGQDKTITLPLNSVMLDGSCSTDPDNDITSYLWTRISGPTSFNLVNAGLVQTEVTNLVEGIILFQLKVTDAGGLFSMDTVQVMVNRQADNSLIDIYVAGHKNSQATYWKNGQQVSLKSGLNNSSATSLAVVGTDVYVAGWEGDFFMYGYNKAKYWKNGNEVLLTGATGAGASSITVAGGEVYVAGWEFKGNKTVAKYWKNGQAISLTNGITDAEATGIVVAGGDVYVAGWEIEGNNTVAKYWKNGQAISLATGPSAYAYSIAVNGSDVYVAGAEYYGMRAAVKYWKNGQEVALTSGSATYAQGTSIAISGSDVYVAGWYGDVYGSAGGSESKASYWKNGQEVALTNGTTYAHASSIVFFGGDVYVAGTDFIGPQSVAMYWKNGQPATVATDAFANSILVVQR
jgi:hypothetical protein